MQEIKKLIIIKNLRWRRVTSVYAVWGHVYILYRVEWHIFLVESRLTRLVCTSLGYHACALDSWKLPLMWPWPGGPAVVARRSTCAQHVIISASTPSATPSHHCADAQRYSGLSWRWDSSVLVKPALLDGCWNMLKSDLHYWEGQGEGLAVWLPYPSGHPKPLVPARVNYYPVHVCLVTSVCVRAYIYIYIFVCMSTKKAV